MIAPSPETRHDSDPVQAACALLVVLVASACAASVPPPSTPAAPTATRAAAAAAAPAPSEPAPPPLPECAAPHALPAPTLGSVNVDAWADELGRYRPQANGGRPAPFEESRASLDGYLGRVSACLERVFAGSFLTSLKSLPQDHPLSDATLATTVELVIDGETGGLADKGIVSSSGVPEFDAAVIATFAGIFPVSEVAPELLSSDGKLYLTWEVTRDPARLGDTTLVRAWKLRF